MKEGMRQENGTRSLLTLTVGLGVLVPFTVVTTSVHGAVVHDYTNVTIDQGHLLVPEGTPGATLVSSTGQIGLGKGGSASYPLDDTWTGGDFSPPHHANAFDRSWFQIVRVSASATFDLGKPCDSVYIALSQDHGPYPEEGLEYRVAVSNSAAGPFTTLPTDTPITMFKKGWSNAGESSVKPFLVLPGSEPAGQGTGTGPWRDTLNDDWSARWQLPGQFRFIQLTPISDVGVYNEPEIDAVMGIPPKAIPTVSAWGLVVVTLLLLTAGKIYFGRRNRVQA